MNKIILNDNIDIDCLSIDDYNKFIGKINCLKLKIRPQYKLEDWQIYNYKSKEIEFFNSLIDNLNDNIIRKNYKNLFYDEFEELEKKEIPFIIEDSIDWENFEENWGWENFFKKFSEINMKIGVDQKEEIIRVKVKEFLSYLKYNTDDSPLYLFEPNLTSEDRKIIIENYKVPKFFKDDIFELLGDIKPPSKWLLCGPKRSGSSIHIDPLQTTAWNTSIHGNKWWVLFPPEIPKWIVLGSRYINNSLEDSAIYYFDQILPNIIKDEGISNLKIIKCIQKPGETIVVPSGWWHAVLNLDNTMAVTQNFCNHYNFSKVWCNLRYSRKKLSKIFLNILKEKREYLYEKALDINRKDMLNTTPIDKINYKIDDNSTNTYYDSSSNESSDTTLFD